MKQEPNQRTKRQKTKERKKERNKEIKKEKIEKRKKKEITYTLIKLERKNIMKLKKTIGYEKERKKERTLK